MTTIYGYALNDSLWTLNYSTYLLKPTWAEVTNGTNVALVTAANSFGAFNQSFNTSNLFIWALLNRTGIGTISPQNDFNVIGDANATGTVYAQRTKNLSIGFDYATNGSLSDTDTFVANYSNFTTIYGYAINDSLWTLNYSTYLLKPTWAQVTNGTNVALITAANSFGAFNQSFNTTNIHLWALLNRTGIQTISPQTIIQCISVDRRHIAC